MVVNPKISSNRSNDQPRMAELVYLVEEAPDLTLARHGESGTRARLASRTVVRCDILSQLIAAYYATFSVTLLTYLNKWSAASATSEGAIIVGSLS
jgi:hypothetical protein